MFLILFSSCHNNKIISEETMELYAFESQNVQTTTEIISEEITSAHEPYENNHYSSIPIDGIEALPRYELFKINNESSESEFSPSSTECIEIDGKIYSYILPYVQEKSTEWEEFEDRILRSSSETSINVHGYDELRSLDFIGVIDIAENPRLLYRVADDIIISADYNFTFRPTGELLHISEDMYVKYSIWSCNNDVD